MISLLWLTLLQVFGPTGTKERADEIARISDCLRLPPAIVDRNYEEIRKRGDPCRNEYDEILAAGRANKEDRAAGRSLPPLPEGFEIDQPRDSKEEDRLALIGIVVMGLGMTAVITFVWACRQFSTVVVMRRMSEAAAVTSLFLVAYFSARRFADVSRAEVPVFAVSVTILGVFLYMRHLRHRK